MRSLRKVNICILLCAVLLSVPVRAEAAPMISAEAAILVEAASGQVLYEKEADRPMKAASTVKIMTALVALEHLEPAESVTVRSEWTGAEGSSMYLRAGQEISVRELLTGLLLCSGNDAAVALACAAAGSEETFTAWMNGKAAALGMENTVFADASGLRADGHSITARDLATLTAEAMQQPLFREIVSAKTAEAGGQSLRNHNKLLWMDERVCGVKTGYTRAAGRTLVSCAESGGMTLICVTLNDPDDWQDHLRLLDWGFGNFRCPDAGGLRFSVPVVSGEGETAEAVPDALPPLLISAGEDIRWEANLPSFVYAPVYAGDDAGTLNGWLPDGTKAVSVPLRWETSIPLAADEELDFWEKLKWSWYYACRHSPASVQYAFY